MTNLSFEEQEQFDREYSLQQSYDRRIGIDGLLKKILKKELRK